MTRTHDSNYWRRVFKRGGYPLMIALARRHAERGHAGQIYNYTEWRRGVDDQTTFPTMSDYTVTWA